MLQKMLILFVFLFMSVNAFAINLSEGEYSYYSFDKLANYEYTLELSVVSGDCDFYGHHSGYPSSSNYHRSSTEENSNDESFTFESSVNSKYYIAVYAYSTCSYLIPTLTKIKLENSSSTVGAGSICEPKNSYLDSVKEIPCLMKKKEWYLAAELMDYWFSGSGKNFMIDIQEIMEISDKLLETILENDRDAANRIVMTDARWKELIGELKKTPNRTGGMLLPNGGEFNFIEQEIPSEDEGWVSSDDEGDTMKWIDEESIGNSFSLDAYGAAFGRGTLRMVTDGEVIIKKDGNIEIHVSKVGFYFKDSYDFSTSQPLGYWSYNSPYVTLYPHSYGTYTDNGSFRYYNESINRSSDDGDFRIFSNMYTLEADESYYEEKYPIYSATETEQKIKKYITKCINKFSSYFGSGVGDMYSCNGSICQNTTGIITLISIDANLNGNEFEYSGGGYGGSLNLSYCN